MLFSFIVTRYNQDISKAIKSIYMSSVPKEEYEIIVCDDLSDTDYPFICDEKIFFGIGKNKSRNRNNGILNASGDYIIFIDGDDYFNPIGIFEIFSEIKNNKGFDIYCQRYLKQKRNTNTFQLKCSNENVFLHGTHSYIISKKFIVENNLFWHEETHNFFWEDMYFGILLHDNTENIYYLKNEWLTYHKLESKTTSDPNFYFENIIESVQKIILDLKKIVKTEKAMKHILMEEKNISKLFIENLRRKNDFF